MLYQISELRRIFPHLPDLQQLNSIRAQENSLRGFHGALEIENHWKVVFCASGEIIEAFLDIRPDSKTFGFVGRLQVSASKPELIVIPPGFAHAFQSISQETISIYATNVEYANQSELDIQVIHKNWNNLWRDNAILSERDSQALTLDQLKVAGKFEL